MTRAALESDFRAFGDELESLVGEIDPGMRARVKRCEHEIEFVTNPVDPRRPKLQILASPIEFGFGLNRMGDDEIGVGPDSWPSLLALVDAVRGGRVRVVHLRNPDEEFYVAYLTTRGRREFAWIAAGASGTRLMKAGTRPVRSYPVASWQPENGI